MLCPFSDLGTVPWGSSGELDDIQEDTTHPSCMRPDPDAAEADTFPALGRVPEADAHLSLVPVRTHLPGVTDGGSPPDLEPRLGYTRLPPGAFQDAPLAPTATTCLTSAQRLAPTGRPLRQPFDSQQVGHDYFMPVRK